MMRRQAPSAGRARAAWSTALSLLLAAALPAAEPAVPAAPDPAASAAAEASPFPDHARCIALGDSITHGGWYHHYLEFFFLTRYPERQVAFINCGSNGESAWQLPKRYAIEVLPAQPTHALVLYGMNDGGLAHYAPGPQPADSAANKERAFTIYEKSIRELLQRLRGDGITPILISPTPYEESPALAWQNHPGYDQALATITARGSALAAQERIPFVDLHTPLDRINAERQAKDPKSTLIGIDRVHPGATTHLAIAYYILKALHVSAVVARTALDATGHVQASEHCQLTQVTAADGGLTWQYQAGAIPFAVEGWLRAGFQLVPFERELNQEIVQVTGLPAGDFDLAIDGKTIRRYSAAQLRDGVDISGEKTPQLAQALHAWGLYRAQFDAHVRLRDLAGAERQLIESSVPRPLTLEQVRTLGDAYLAKAAGTPGEDKARKQVAALIDLKSHEQEWRQGISGTLERVRELVVPKPHQMRITPAKP